MKKLSILMCGILVGFATAATNIFAAVETNSPAPNFTAINTKNETIKLDQFKGKYIVLEWTNHECPFVVKHYAPGNMQNLQRMYTEQGVVWISIISSAPGKQGFVSNDQADAIASEQGAKPSHIIRDPSGEIGRLYEAKTTPHMFVIDPDGIVVYQGAIDSTRSVDSADIMTSENYVSSALNSLLAGNTVETSTTKPYGCSVKY